MDERRAKGAIDDQLARFSRADQRLARLSLLRQQQLVVGPPGLESGAVREQVTQRDLLLFVKYCLQNCHML